MKTNLFILYLLSDQVSTRRDVWRRRRSKGVTKKKRTQINKFINIALYKKEKKTNEIKKENWWSIP